MKLVINGKQKCYKSIFKSKIILYAMHQFNCDYCRYYGKRTSAMIWSRNNYCTFGIKPPHRRIIIKDFRLRYMDICGEWRCKYEFVY